MASRRTSSGYSQTSSRKSPRTISRRRMLRFSTCKTSITISGIGPVILALSRNLSPAGPGSPPRSVGYRTNVMQRSGNLSWGYCPKHKYPASVGTTRPSTSVVTRKVRSMSTSYPYDCLNTTIGVLASTAVTPRRSPFLSLAEHNSLHNSLLSSCKGARLGLPEQVPRRPTCVTARSSSASSWSPAAHVGSPTTGSAPGCWRPSTAMRPAGSSAPWSPGRPVLDGAPTGRRPPRWPPPARGRSRGCRPPRAPRRWGRHGRPVRPPTRHPR